MGGLIRPTRPINPTLSRSPFAVREESGEILGEVGGEEWEGLALGADEVGPNADEGDPSDGLVEKDFAGDAFAGGDLGSHGDAVVADPEDVVAGKVHLAAVVAGDDAGDNNVPIAVRRE